MDHAPDHHAPHSHGHDHDHAHDHDHSHGGSDYYLQQLLTIFICGAFGVAGILMYTLAAGQGVNDADGKPLTKLGVLLVPGFHPWVLGGSILLIGITVIRGIALWRSAGAAHDHSHAHDDHHHEHKPGEACDHPSHTHDHHDHDHGDHTAEDHSHGNIYWRVVVLLLPIVILVMGLPNGTFSPEYQLGLVKGNKVGDLQDLADTGEFTGGFEDIAAAAYSEPSREAFTGMTIRVNGKVKKLTDTQFTLFYFKMTCCAADQVPLKATCVVKNASDLSAFPDAQEVTVRGQIQFSQDTTTGEYVTVIKVAEGGLTRRGK